MRKSLSFLLISAVFITSGCTSFQFLSEMIKSRPQIDTNSPIAENGARYKIGHPYKIKGITYYPKVDYSYEEVGIASWYGDAFHGKTTANGGIFNMHAVSAAHRTLPLPSIVEVENLNNGRKLIVKVNDRGPFHDNRIIDLSKRAAELLGFQNKGVTKVRVRILAEESRQLAAQMQNKKTARNTKPKKSGDVTLTRVADGKKDTPPKVITVPLRDIAGSQSSTDVMTPPKAGVYVQVAALSQYESALTIRQRIDSYQSTIGASESPSGDGSRLYKVLVGPFSNTALASRAREDLKHNSFPSAHLITWRS